MVYNQTVVVDVSAHVAQSQLFRSILGTIYVLSEADLVPSR